MDPCCHHVGHDNGDFFSAPHKGDPCKQPATIFGEKQIPVDVKRASYWEAHFAFPARRWLEVERPCSREQGCVSAESRFFWLAPGESYHPSGILSPDST